MEEMIDELLPYGVAREPVYAAAKAALKRDGLTFDEVTFYISHGQLVYSYSSDDEDEVKSTIVYQMRES